MRLLSRRLLLSLTLALAAVTGAHAQSRIGESTVLPVWNQTTGKVEALLLLEPAKETTLGARTPKDIPVDAQGRVRPETGGMSVRPRIADIPAAFLPRRLKYLNRNAGGSESVVVFRYGDVNASFAAAPVAPALFLRPDAPGHGNVEPRAEMGTTPTRLRSTRRARDG